MTWTHIGSANNGTTSSSPTFDVTFPAGSAVGHLAVLGATVNDASTATAALDNSPAGWTALGALPDNGVTNAFMSTVGYWKILDSVDIGNGLVAVNFNGFRTYELAVSVWGASGTITFDTAVTSKGTGNGTVTPVQAAGVTTSAANELVFIVFTASQATAVYTFDGRFTLRTSGVHSTRNAAVATAEIANPGSTGAVDASISNSFFGYVTYVAAFKETSAGAASSPPLRPFRSLVCR